MGGVPSAGAERAVVLPSSHDTKRWWISAALCAALSIMPVRDSRAQDAGAASLHRYDGTWRILLRSESLDPDCVALEFAATVIVERSSVSGVLNHESAGVMSSRARSRATVRRSSSPTATIR